MSSKYPSREEIASIFGNMETKNYAAMFERISPDVDWTVMGTHPCAGRYTNLKDFQEGAVVRLSKIMKEPGINPVVRNVIGGGDQEWATVELVAVAECNNGLKFDNAYAWIVRFNEDGMVVEVRAYLDSWLVREAVEQNECPSNRAPLPQLG